MDKEECVDGNYEEMYWGGAWTVRFPVLEDPPHPKFPAVFLSWLWEWEKILKNLESRSNATDKLLCTLDVGGECHTVLVDCSPQTDTAARMPRELPASKLFKSWVKSRCTLWWDMQNRYKVQSISRDSSSFSVVRVYLCISFHPLV